MSGSVTMQAIDDQLARLTAAIPALRAALASAGALLEQITAASGADAETVSRFTAALATDRAAITDKLEHAEAWTARAKLRRAALTGAATATAPDDIFELVREATGAATSAQADVDRLRAAAER